MVKSEKIKEREIQLPIKGLSGLAILLLVFVLIGAFIYNVPKGSNGCIFSKFTAWDYTEKDQGLHLKIPLFEDVTRVSFQTRTLGVHKDGKGEKAVLTPKDKNGINFNVDVTIRYKLQEAQICEFVEQKGRNPEAVLLTALRSDSTRGVFGKYAQEDVPQNRMEIAKEITKVLQEKINQETSGRLQEGFIVIERVDLRNIEFNQRIEERIIAKQEKLQEAQEMEYKLMTADKTREMEIINADRDRQTSILRAEGTAQAILIEASAKAEGIQKVNNAYQQMPREYVEVKYAEALKELASTGNVIVMDLGRFQGGTNIGFMDYNQLMGIPQIRT